MSLAPSRPPLFFYRSVDGAGCSRRHVGRGGASSYTIAAQLFRAELADH
jgi:hypothetical protein